MTFFPWVVYHEKKMRESVMLTIDVEKNGGVAVVHCSGRLVRGVEVCTLRNAVASREKNTRIVVLDLSQVEFMDAGGLNALVSLITGRVTTASSSN